MTSSLDQLLRSAARYPLLTTAQEIELGRAIRAWQDWPDGPDEAPESIQRLGKKALDRFVCSNLRLAHHIARRFRNRGVSDEDLTQAGIEGLITAYTRFRPDLGFRSSSYACWYIQQQCQIAIAQHGTGLRLPTSISEALRRLNRINHELRGKLGRPPTDLEMAKAAKLKPSQLDALRLAARNGDLISLDQSCVEGGSPLGDTLSSEDQPQEQIERNEIREILHGLITTHEDLTPQQRFILRCRFFLEQAPSLARIASRLNISRDSVRKQEAAALLILRQALPPEVAAYQNVP